MSGFAIEVRKMTREEMLEKLHSISPGVELVALTSEYALERTFVCKKGIDYDWVSFDEPWPAIKITDLTEDILFGIKDKLRNKCLSEDDLSGTQLLSMINGFGKNSDICNACAGLQDMTLGKEQSLYVLCDLYTNPTTFYFYTDYELFAEAFEDLYICVTTKWEDLSDEDLASWIERFEFEFSDIPLCEYSVEDDE